MYNLKCNEFPKGDVHFEHIIYVKKHRTVLEIFVGMALQRMEKPSLLFIKEFLNFCFCIPTKCIKAHEAEWGDIWKNIK